MINKQAIDTMTQMLSLITEYAKGAYPEVETHASDVNRQRAWSLTCMLARFAEHAAESDMYFLLAEDPRKTDAEREHCYRMARQEDNGFMHELNEFRKCAEEFKNEPVTGTIRTDNDIVRELERLLKNVRALQKMHEGFAESGAAKVTKKERERCEASRTVIAEELASVKQQLEVTKNLALSRGMVVSLNRYRTVIKRIAPAPAQSTKQPSAATKAKKAPVLKLVAKTTAQQSKTKASPAKKSA